MTYLLDTNVWIESLRSRGSSALQNKLKSIHPNDIGLSAIVVAELFEGCYRSANQMANLKEVQELLALFPALPFDHEAARQAGEIEASLRAQGKPIDYRDVLIAATARSRSLTLVTHNQKDFSRIPNLRIEDWQSA